MRLMRFARDESKPWRKWWSIRTKRPGLVSAVRGLSETTSARACMSGMKADISEAKRKVPLPALLHRLGLGRHAKKSARCPFHEDKHNSFSIWPRDGSW